MKKPPAYAFTLGAIVIIALIGFFLAAYPLGPRETPPSGYAPLRDDNLALRYLPSFDCPEEFGPIIAVYYRSASEESGILRMAYHPVWERERNDTKAFLPFLSRWLYTGGLSLQRAMYGKGDVESIGISIDPVTGEILGIEFETAAGYSSSDFSVRHEKVIRKGPFSLPLRFKVMSWNHLFALDETIVPNNDRTLGAGGPPLGYFTSGLWDEYAMWKNPETILRKNRAHFIWERAASP